MSRYYTQKYIWIVPRAGSLPRWTYITHAFKSDLWLCIVLSAIIVSFTVKWFSYLTHIDTIKFLLNLWSVFLNVSINISHNIYLRVILLSWILLSISLTTVFQSFMTSFYTEPGKKHQINNIVELENSDLYLSVPISICEHSNILYNSNKSFFLLFLDNYRMIGFGLYNSNIATLTTEEVLLYYSRKHFKNISSLYKMVDGGVSIHRIYKLVPSSPLIPLVNQITTRLVEGGIVDKIVHDFLDPSGWTRGLTFGKSSSDFKSLTMFHMTSPFIYLFLGHIMSIFAFIAELLVFFII
ncbi:hypothetical protein L9F63_023208 [Diploptera punctata]|uniref:Ionotropic glutamate receptor C-terminal domain-containing protein n=1 Tax=Diploptera punctata TaxID=6984 RepID=A0AAD7ZJR7_DIPPU|nr:hypothetical protein L9F63_023208 [Diploptera punctata]